jgi:integrase
LKALRSFYGWAEDRGLCRSPVRHLKIPKKKYGPAASLSDEDLERLLVAADGIDPRTRWVLQLMYATGARVASICAVTPDDIQDGLIHFREAKFDKSYAVPLGAKGQEAVEHLMALLDYKAPRAKGRRPTLVGVGPAAVWHWTNVAGQAIGLRVYPHLLRHTFGTKLARDPTVSQIDWVTLMNHRDGSQLRRYASASAEGLRSAVDRL